LDVGILGTDREFLEIIENWIKIAGFPSEVMAGGLAFAEKNSVGAGGLNNEGNIDDLDDYGISTLFG
jgi:hypothetical protein